MNTFLVWIVVIGGTSPQYQPTSLPHQFADKESCVRVALTAQHNSYGAEYVKTTCIQVRVVK